MDIGKNFFGNNSHPIKSQCLISLVKSNKDINVNDVDVKRLKEDESTRFTELKMKLT